MTFPQPNRTGTLVTPAYALCRWFAHCHPTDKWKAPPAPHKLHPSWPAVFPVAAWLSLSPPRSCWNCKAAGTGGAGASWCSHHLASYGKDIDGADGWAAWALCPWRTEDSPGKEIRKVKAPLGHHETHFLSHDFLNSCLNVYIWNIHTVCSVRSRKAQHELPCSEQFPVMGRNPGPLILTCPIPPHRQPLLSALKAIYFLF